MDMVVLAVGRLRPHYRAACDEYRRRIERYSPIRELSIKEASRAPTRLAQLAQEGQALRKKLPAESTLVALSRQGDAWSSRELARRLGRWQERGTPLVFLIGGSIGLAPDLLEAAHHRWSLGALTLPHELARVIVYEQVYRGWTILGGEQYHKGG